MQRRITRLISIISILSVLATLGCAKTESSGSDLWSDFDVFAWARSWKYPVDNLPPNMKLATPVNGPVKVQIGNFNYQVPKENQPWASWWYPTKDKSIFEGNRAPLKKYDRLRQSQGKASTTSDKWAAQYSASAVAWAGLCDSWSLAAVYEFEPTTSLKIGSECLTPADQRALLIAAYKDQGADLKSNNFGQLNKNGPNDIYADIYPDQLHSIISKQLGERKSAFLIDTDAGAEVWTVPVYAADLKIAKLGESVDTVTVELLITYPEFQLTPEQRAESENKSLGNIFVKRKYTYNLYGAWVGTDFVVEGGEWTGSSEKDHPDYAIVLPKTNEILNNQKPELAGAEHVNYLDLINLLNTGKEVSACK